MFCDILYCFVLTDRTDFLNSIDEITLHFGIINVQTLEPSQHHVARSISAVIINPNSVDIDIRNNDIALLHLSSPIDFTDYVRPACVQVEPNEVEYQTCWVAGWGALGTATDFDPDDGVYFPRRFSFAY